MFKKLIDDTLKSPNGKWSRKSLTTFVSFVVSIVLGSYIVVSNYITDRPMSTDAVLVFFGFLTMAGYSNHLSLKDKIDNRNSSLNKEETP